MASPNCIHSPSCIQFKLCSLNMSGFLYVSCILIKWLKRKIYHLLNIQEVPKKKIHNSLYRLLEYSFFFQLHSYMRPDFLHTRQSEQHFTTDCIQKQAWDCCFPLSQTFKRFANAKQYRSSHFIFLFKNMLLIKGFKLICNLKNF